MSGADAGASPLIGAEVVTTDGQTLGVIAEVADRSFKVDVKLAVDYWLPLDVIARSDGRGVHLSIAESELTDARNRANDLLVESAVDEAAIQQRLKDDTTP